MFHDVGFAAGWPGDGGDVVAEEPECRPDALATGRQLDAGLEAPVGLREESLSVDARGRVVARDAICPGKVLFPRRDDEVAVSLLRIDRTTGVTLQLIIRIVSARLKRFWPR